MTRAVKVELYGSNNDGGARRYTIADGTAVSKGQFLILTDPRTAATATGIYELPCAGIAAEEKNADDGATSITCWTDGIFEVVASGAIPVGASVCNSSGTGHDSVIYDANIVAASMGSIIGWALETAADAEVINVRLRL